MSVTYPISSLEEALDCVTPLASHLWDENHRKVALRASAATTMSSVKNMDWYYNHHFSIPAYFGVFWNPRFGDNTFQTMDTITKTSFWSQDVLKVIRYAPLPEAALVRLASNSTTYRATYQREAELPLPVQKVALEGILDGSRQLLAVRAEIDSQIAARLAGLPDDNISSLGAKKLLARNSAVTGEVLETLSYCSDKEVRQIVASRADLSNETWLRLASDKKTRVVRTVAENPKAYTEARVLATLSQGG